MRLRYVVTISREEGRPPVVVGPFQSAAGAEARAEKIREALGLYSDSEVEVVYIDPSSTSMRDILEAVR
jgi:hypothetical protein